MAQAFGVFLLATGGAWSLGMAGFLSAAPDVPLAAGLEELADGVMVFDKPQGRIVQITTVPNGQAAARDIRDFYRASLPNLGWQSVGEGDAANAALLTFRRKGEILRLTFSADLVVFDLAPAGLTETAR